jgi:threonine synthase
MFYFFFAYKSIKKTKQTFIFSCPSGNFGNICKDYCKKMGLPVGHL